MHAIRLSARSLTTALMKTMLLAVGGNSLIRAGEKGTIAEQRANAQRTAAQIVGLIRAGYRIVLTHGNGPQVGAALLRSERGASQVPGHPLDVCGASTQGEIGYLLQQALQTELQRADLHVPVATVLTQMPGVAGRSFDAAPQQADRPFLFARRCRRTQTPFRMGDRRRRRPRLSPRGPVARARLTLLNSKSFAIWSSKACWSSPAEAEEFPWSGGTGDCKASRQSSTRIASPRCWPHASDVDLFVISTDTDYVYLDYKKPTQRPLRQVSCSGAGGVREGRPLSSRKHGPKNRIRAALSAQRRQGSHHYFLRKSVPGGCRICGHTHASRSRP